MTRWLPAQWPPGWVEAANRGPRPRVQPAA